MLSVLALQDDSFDRGQGLCTGYSQGSARGPAVVLAIAGRFSAIGKGVIDFVSGLLTCIFCCDASVKHRLRPPRVVAGQWQMQRQQVSGMEPSSNLIRRSHCQ
jgi:hypothetical protein